MASANPDFKKKLAALKAKRLEAEKLNKREVVEEDRLKKLPKNYVKKRERLQKELELEEKRGQASKDGRDFDREELLNISAMDAERWERKKRKRNPDQGFSNFEDATKRQHTRLINEMKVNLDEYEEEKQKIGEAAFYGEDNTISIGLHKDSKESIDNMVDILNKQIEKREKYSRRRTHDEDDDINFINERNMKFNKKLERFYGEYTQEIKQNLERGTAV